MNNRYDEFVLFLEVSGQIIILSICWVLCCVPVITAGPACSALYYAVAKVVRCKRGRMLSEFWRCFCDNLRVGIPLGIVILVYGFLAVNSVYFAIASQMPGVFRWITGGVGVAFLLLMLFTVPYVFLLLSRFDFRLKDCLLNSFYFACCNWKATAKLLMISLLGGALLYFIPYFAVWVPGVVAYASSFVFEPALKGYMPQGDENAEDNGDHWYLEL